MWLAHHNISLVPSYSVKKRVIDYKTKTPLTHFGGPQCKKVAECSKDLIASVISVRFSLPGTISGTCLLYPILQIANLSSLSSLNCVKEELGQAGVGWTEPRWRRRHCPDRTTSRADG